MSKRVSVRRMMKQSNHSAFEGLNFSMNSLSLGPRHGPRHSFSGAAFAPIYQGVSSPVPNHPPRLQHAHSTAGEHLRSQSAILPDLAGSLDSSFGLLNTPTYGSASFLGISGYGGMLNHSVSANFTPARSFSVQDQMMHVENVVGSDATANLGLNSDHQTTPSGLVLNRVATATESGLALSSAEHAKT